MAAQKETDVSMDTSESLPRPPPPFTISIEKPTETIEKKEKETGLEPIPLARQKREHGPSIPPPPARGQVYMMSTDKTDPATQAAMYRMAKKLNPDTEPKVVFHKDTPSKLEMEFEEKQRLAKEKSKEFKKKPPTILKRELDKKIPVSDKTTGEKRKGELPERDDVDKEMKKIEETIDERKKKVKDEDIQSIMLDIDELAKGMQSVQIAAKGVIYDIFRKDIREIIEKQEKITLSEESIKGIDKFLNHFSNAMAITYVKKIQEMLSIPNEKGKKLQVGMSFK